MGAVQQSTAHCINHILAAAQIWIGSLAQSQLPRISYNSKSGAKEPRYTARRIMRETHAI